MIHNERMEKVFKNHIATVKQLDDDTQVLTWKKPGTWWYKIDYVFYKNMIFITGDLRDAVFNCTWEPRWDTDWTEITPYDFAEKMTANKDGKYTWNSDDAVDDLFSQYSVYFDDLECEELKELTERIEFLQRYNMKITNEEDLNKLPYHKYVNSDMLLQYSLAIGHAINSSNEYEFVYGLQNDHNFYDFNDFREWGYKCGRRHNNDTLWYLMGLQMAYKQLKEVSSDES